jgi:O-antigen/teichoic acid export membrane protein
LSAKPGAAKYSTENKSSGTILKRVFMSRVSKNIIYNILGQLLILIIGFVAIKYIFKQLGEDALGIIYFTAMLKGLLGAVLESGIGFATVREVSAHIDSEPRYINDFIRTFSLYYWAAFVLLAGLIFILAPVFIDKLVNLKTLDPATAIYVLRILGISSLLALPKSFYYSLFCGLQRMEFNNSIDIFTTALQQFGAILILVLKGNLFHVVYWFAGCYVLNIMIYLFLSARFFPREALVPGYFSYVIKRNLGFSSVLAGASLLVTIHMQADKFIVAKLLPIGILGYYGVAYSIASKGVLFSSAISQAVFPSFSAKFQEGDHTGLISQYNKQQDLLCFFVVPVFAAIPFASLPLFSYVLNADIAKLLFLPVTLLCAGFYMNSAITIPGVFLLAVGKPGISARMNFYALFAVLPVTALLIYYFGLIGAGFSWIFYHVFAYLYTIPKFCAESRIISAAKWYFYLMRIFILIAMTYGVAWMVLGAIGNHSIFALVIAYVSASIAYLFGSYFLIGNALKEAILRVFRSCKAKIIEFA